MEVEGMNRKFYRLFELLILFALLPLFIAATGWTQACFPLLWFTGFVGSWLLARDPFFDWRPVWDSSAFRRHIRGMILRFVISAFVITVGVVALAPSRLFSFVREHPGWWALFMLLYPILSVFPQGFVYRTFFFHRYKALFPSGWSMILASASAFSLAHIVFGNYIAVVFTFVGGLFFAQTYRDTRSLLISVIEHSLYGCFIFTIGLGKFFFLRHHG
jgi:membrane protease YdiL (CAAX protease family)